MSFILLGILNSQVSGAAGGSYELIESNILTSSASSVTFSSIPQDYKHLQIRATMRTDLGAPDDVPMLRVNNDSTASYNAHYLFANGSSVSSSKQITQTYLRMNIRVPGGTGTTSAYGAMVMDILDYSATTKYKTIRELDGFAGNQQQINLGSGALRSTSAITSLQFGMYLTSSNFVAGSRFSLYGIRG